MKIVICKDYEKICKKAADIIIEEIQYNLNAILELATGRTL